VKSFRTLDLAVEFYEKCEEIELKGHLRDQLSRAASSISLNLAEGNAKRTVKEKRRYYHTAYASTHECKTILRLIKNKDAELDELLDKLGACIYRLMNAEIRTLPYTVNS
jgi:four helix bundle protein